LFDLTAVQSGILIGLHTNHGYQPGIVRNQKRLQPRANHYSVAREVEPCLRGTLRLCSQD